MSRAALLFWVLIVWTMTSMAAAACAYPASLQMVNKTMIAQLKRGGEVSMFVRNSLRRSLDRMPADAMLTTLSGEVGWRDLRAARTVLEVATALADGRGFTIDPDLRQHTSRLNDAVQAACSDGTQGASGAAETNAVERSDARKEVGTSVGLTFGEGMARLSVAFSIYAVFLAFLFAFRQFYHHNYVTRPGGASDEAIGPMAEIPPDLRRTR
ncbi:hypothetical protein [uncultured Tateyamaria sp.]|uniref:hypothetical protein n=1 Tax=uncultured Tateyamaria sp. TaxID=455651 RepID=UPI002633D840|nr:hypothetical protein [uncultured Tateyamaria sp.]